MYEIFVKRVYVCLYIHRHTHIHMNNLHFIHKNNFHHFFKKRIFSKKVGKKWNQVGKRPGSEDIILLTLLLSTGLKETKNYILLWVWREKLEGALFTCPVPETRGRGNIQDGVMTKSDRQKAWGHGSEQQMMTLGESQTYFLCTSTLFTSDHYKISPEQLIQPCLPVWINLF